LELGAGALRAASEKEAAVAGVPHTTRLLFLRGTESGSIAEDHYQLDVKLLLEAPSPDICMTWLSGGRSLLTPWEALVGAGLSEWDDAIRVRELLRSVLPPLPGTADNDIGIASRMLARRGRCFVLNVQHWLAPTASVGLSGTSSVHQAAVAIDQASSMSVIGPALRLGLLVAQVGVLAVLTDDRDAQRKDAVGTCEGVAFDLLSHIFVQLRKHPSELGAAKVDQLCTVMVQVEIVLQEVEATFFTAAAKAAVAGAVIHGWAQRLQDIYDKITSSEHGALGLVLGRDRAEHGVDWWMRRGPEVGQELGSIPPVDPGLAVSTVGRRPGVLHRDHMEGVDKPNRVVRATLATSRALLPDDGSCAAFAALGILPANEQIGLHVLERLWRPQLGVTGGADEGSCSSRPQGLFSGDVAVHPGVLRLVEVLVQAGLLRQVVADRGLVAGVIVHPVVREYAHSLLGEDGIAAHQRLMDEHAKDCPVDDTDTYGWLYYHFWTTADDGYWYKNVARHAAASKDVLAMASLMTEEWHRARSRTGSRAGHQGDVGLVLASLRAIIDDSDHSVHNPPVLLGAAHWGLAMAFLCQMGCNTTENQEAAANLLRRGLEVVPRAAAPLLWAQLQNDLGFLYSHRGNSDKAANFQIALRCFYRALEVRTRETTPFPWAETQHCLGMAYVDRAGGDKVINLAEAMAYFRHALEVRTREMAPVKWAETTHSMGEAYAARVDGDKTANMEEAVACYRRALEVWTQETSPLQWALAQHSMGAAYGARIEGDEAVNMEEALACFRRALQEQTQEVTPLAWATTQNSMGAAYAKRVDGDKAANLEQAVACYWRVLNVWTQEAEPAAWASTHLKLADLFEQQMGGERGASQINNEMVACYRRALEVWTREAAPYGWAEIQDRIGSAYAQREDGDKAANMEEALASYQRALEVWTRETEPHAWALVQDRMGAAFAQRVDGDQAANTEEALTCIQRALEVLTPEVEPLLWASAQHRAGLAYAERVGGDRTANLTEAVACYGRALEVRTREAAPQLWASTTWGMLEALQGGEHWAEALEGAHALHAFGSEWERWDELEASLVTRVAQLERALETPRGWFLRRALQLCRARHGRRQ